MAIHTPWSKTQRPAPDSMTLVEHLGELRRRLIVCLLAGLAGGVVAFVAYNHIMSALIQPYCATHPHHACLLYVTGPLQGFSIRVKIAAYGGIFLASPILLWQVWRFITPGLNPNEKRYAVPFITSSIALFLTGGAIAYFVSNRALHFLGVIGGHHLTQIYSPNSYITFIVALMVAFGLAFELPVVLVCLELAGVLSPARLVKWRRYAIVIIFALAAIFIPSSDPYSLFAMAIPMCLFYELAIIVGKVLRR